MTGFFQNLRDKLFNNKFPMVGVDISDTSIEFLQLQPGLGKPKIKAEYRLALEPGLIVNGRIGDLSKVAIILQAAFKKEVFKNNYCLLSLPDKETYFLNLKSDNPEAEIYGLAQENLPIDLSQCYYDYILTGGNEIFFAAAPKEIIKQYMDLFKLANLNLVAIDFESACLVRALIETKEIKEPVFIVDTGAKSTDIVLVDSCGYQDQINFACGGYFISQKIAEELKKDYDTAEKMKIEKGIKIEGIDLEGILIGMYNPIFAEIKRMSLKYQTKAKMPAQKIILAGGTSLLPGMLEIFKKILPDYQIELGNLERKIDFSGRLLGSDKILYANVIGLALRGIDKESLNQGINLIKNLT